MAPESRLAERLADYLSQRPSVSGHRIEGWWLDISSRETVSAGVRDSALGGPYEPPATARGSGGSLYARWSDGRCSIASVGLSVLDDLDGALREWRDSAFLDPDAVPIAPPPASLPTVQTADPAAERMVTGPILPLLQELASAQRRLAAVGEQRLHADYTVGASVRTVLSSRGLAVSYPETAVSFYLGADDIYWRSFARRRLPTEAELSDLRDSVASTMQVLRRSAESSPSGETPVLIQPSLTANLFGRFLISNLIGSAILAGRSTYSIEDFQSGKQVAVDILSVAVDSTLDLENAASPVSGEGVPGGRAVLLQHGRLAQPIVDLKHAAKSGFPPTPAPAGAPTFVIETREAQPMVEQVRGSMGTGLEISAVLGLNGQDPLAGRYNLVVPQAVVIRDGESVGRARVALAGSFFEHLLDARTRFVRYPWGFNPGLLVWTRVEPR